MNWKPYFLASLSDRSRAAKAELEEVYGKIAPKDANVVVCSGGDGLLLKALMLGLKMGLPVFPMHRGTKGDKANDYNTQGLLERLDKAQRLNFHPLKVRGTYECSENGQTVRCEREFYAMNDVYVKTLSPSQGCNLKITSDQGLDSYIEGDGVIIGTPFGNGAYTRSAGGPYIGLTDRLLSATAICPYHGSLKQTLPENSVIHIQGVNLAHRPIRLVADHEPQMVDNLIECDISLDTTKQATILYDSAWVKRKQHVDDFIKKDEISKACRYFAGGQFVRNCMSIKTANYLS